MLSFGTADLPCRIRLRRALAVRSRSGNAPVLAISPRHGTLAEGVKVGSAADAGEWIAGRWTAVVDTMGEILPAYGFTQTGREVAAARAAAEWTLVAA